MTEVENVTPAMETAVILKYGSKENAINVWWYKSASVDDNDYWEQFVIIKWRLEPLPS